MTPKAQRDWTSHGKKKKRRDGKVQPKHAGRGHGTDEREQEQWRPAGQRKTRACNACADSHHALAAQGDMMRLGARRGDRTGVQKTFVHGDSQQVAACLTCSLEQPWTHVQAGSSVREGPRAPFPALQILCKDGRTDWPTYHSVPVLTSSSRRKDVDFRTNTHGVRIRGIPRQCGV